MNDIVQKLWGFCHTLRHDGIDYGDYIEQLTYLLFLKMADEKGIAIPMGFGWRVLREKSGTDLADHYVETLRRLGKERGILGDIFAGALSKFNNPVNLHRLIALVDDINWTGLGVDVKASAYEGLLEKSASEGKKGAGQFFTPRVLIDAIVRCVKPDPRVAKDFTINDPAAGTGGFLVAAYEWLMHETKGAVDRAVAKRLRTDVYSGNELVARPRRLALMNLYLHGIEDGITLGDTIYNPDPGTRFDCVLTNPPFGTRGANQAPDRDDFTVATSNKQLNFLQHVMTTLKPGGRAAVVLPDNCLFADQAGEVFKLLTEDCRLHTILRLPHGTFSPYSQGVKANVVFFTKGIATDAVWIYDARTNVSGITKKGRPLVSARFAEFEKCYGADPNGLSKRKASDSKGDRWRKFGIKEVIGKEFKLDGFKWLKEESLDDADERPEPEELATETIAALEQAILEFNEAMALLQDEPNRETDRSTVASVGNEQQSPNGGTDVIGELRRYVPAREWLEPSFAHRSETPLPASWCFVALGNLGVWRSGGTPSKAKRQYWQGGAIPWVSPKDMKRRVLGDSIDHVTTRAVEESRLHLLPPGTVLFVVRGMILAHTFPIAVTESALTINQDLRAITPHAPVDPRFLLLALEAAAGHILFVVKESTHGTRRLESDQLKHWPVPIPPLPQQLNVVRRVEACLSLFERATGRVEMTRDQARFLRQSTLAKAMRGEIGSAGAEHPPRGPRTQDSTEAVLSRVARDEAARGSPTDSEPRQVGEARTKGQHA